jgi:membrane protein DedA with SNARE-associated domain
MSISSDLNCKFVENVATHGPLASGREALYEPASSTGCNPDFVAKRQECVLHQFFHWFFHDLTPWVTGVAQAHPIWCFPIAFVVAFSESFVGVSFIVPGTFLLITLGAVIGASHISVIPAWAGAVIGSVLGDWISFWIGFHYHHQILHIWPVRNFEAQMEKGLHFFHRFGTWAIFLGRFLGPFRATVPLVAGMSELEFWPFQFANTASAILWAFALLTPVGEAVRHLMPA